MPKKEEEKDIKIGETSTTYTLMKRCGNCFEICFIHHIKCPQCKYLFVRQANAEETTQSSRTIEELKEKKKEEKNDTRNL